MISSARQEICDLIDEIPERNLYPLRPLLCLLRDNSTEDDNGLSGEKRELPEECRRDRKERPESFTPWEEARGA